MMSPGRIRSSTHRLGTVWLLMAILLVLVLPTPGHAEPMVEVITQDSGVGDSEEGGITKIFSVPIHIALGVDIGYDDNITTSQNGEGAWFTGEHITLSYDRTNPRTQFHLIMGGGLTNYFDSTSAQDENGSVTLSLHHNLTERLSVAADIYASYQVEPDFNTNVGPENIRAAHFQTTDSFQIGYRWLPRFATISSYTFRMVKYDDASIGLFQDRTESTLGQIFQFSRSHRTNLFGEYRFQDVNYDSIPNDSTTHYALIGFDHKMTEHWTVGARGGETLRSFELGGDRSDPYAEGFVDYTKSGRSSLRWTASYGVEEPSSTSTGTSVNLTFRTGVQASYNLTARTSAVLAFYYNRAKSESVVGSESAPDEDSLSLAFGLRYAVNSRLAFHIDYNRTSVNSDAPADVATSDYSRNRYFVGLNLTY
jgi:hypothetical protein